MPRTESFVVNSWNRNIEKLNVFEGIEPQLRHLEPVGHEWVVHSRKAGYVRTVTAARQEARAELDTHPPTPTSIHTHPHPTRPTPTPAHTHPQTMFFNSAIASSRASIAVFRLPWMSHLHIPIYKNISVPLSMSGPSSIPIRTYVQIYSDSVSIVSRIAFPLAQGCEKGVQT